MQTERLYHISENRNIGTFIPRPSPSVFNGLNDDVVFAISEKLLHNYLLPRDCPRVCYYVLPKTTEADKAFFLNSSKAEFIVCVEEEWLEKITTTMLYCYEFLPETFELLDDCAGYYISYQSVKPISVSKIENPFEALMNRTNVELKTLPTLGALAEQVLKSSLGFSLIRMRNAS